MLYIEYYYSEGATAISLGESGVRESFEIHSLQCTGAEANLTECFYLVVSIFSCYYSGDSDYGVKCPGKYVLVLIFHYIPSSLMFIHHQLSCG